MYNSFLSAESIDIRHIISHTHPRKNTNVAEVCSKRESCAYYTIIYNIIALPHGRTHYTTLVVGRRGNHASRIIYKQGADGLDTNASTHTPTRCTPHDDLTPTAVGIALQNAGCDAISYYKTIILYSLSY